MAYIEHSVHHMTAHELGDFMMTQIYETDVIMMDLRLVGTAQTRTMRIWYADGPRDAEGRIPGDPIDEDELTERM